MGFSKAFPRYVGKSTYPVWEEITLSEAEERQVEESARLENIKLMKECIDDTAIIFKEKKLKDFQSDIIRIALGLFEKRAGHLVYFKESKCKEKFDEAFK